MSRNRPKKFQTRFKEGLSESFYKNVFVEMTLFLKVAQFLMKKIWVFLIFACDHFLAVFSHFL